MRLLFAAALFGWVHLVGCSNWAQLSGSNNQNNVWSAETPPWTRRWGFASTFIQQYVLPAESLDIPLVPGQSPSPSPQPQLSAPSKMLILGGEEWRVDDSGKTVSPPPMAGQGSTLRNKGGGTPGGFGQDFDGVPLLPNEPPADMRAPDVAGAVAGARALSNDVFVTEGKSWRAYTDNRQRTVEGEPQPMLVSNVSWVTRAPWGGIPAQYLGNWKNYLGCCHPPVPGSAFSGYASLSKPFSCTLSPAEATAGCLDENGALTDPYKDSRRWSPRRGASAVTLYEAGRAPAVFVMGGRARSFQTQKLQELSNLPGGDDPFKREKTWLMSDVWVSYDEGATWDFRNVGCWALSANTATLPTDNRCSTNTDCFAQNLGDTVCVKAKSSDALGSCVCKGWSPREFFAAAVNLWKADTPYLYIAGGVGAAQGQMCGRVACGEDYGVFYTDVWRSGSSAGAKIGTKWELITPMGGAMVKGESGRGHPLLMFANYRMFYLTGLGTLKGDAAKNDMFSSMYVSEHGDLWEPFNYPPNVDPASFSPRAGALGATDINSLFVFGGIEPAPGQPAPQAQSAPAAAAAAALAAPTNLKGPPAPTPPPNPWFTVSGEAVLPSAAFYQMILADQAVLDAKFKGASKSRWYRDFENPLQPKIASYIHPHWPLSQPLDVLNVSAADAAKLADKFGIYNARQLSAISRDHVLNALDKHQANIPDICLYLRAAQAFCYHCDVKFRPFAGFDDWSLFDPSQSPSLYVAGAEPNPPPAPPDDGCTTDNWATMNAPPDWASTDNTALGPFDPTTVEPMFRGTDYVCRSTPPPRRNGGMAVMDGTVYVAGGLLAPDFYANDLWYRDDVPPVTTITTLPAGADTTLNVQCSEGIACLFEARFYDGGWELDDNGEPVFKGNLLRDWALLPLPYDVIAINGPRKPTTVHVRAIDAAGNKDFSNRAVCCSQSDVNDKYKIGNCVVLCPGVSLANVKDPPPIPPGGVNVHTWTYEPPFPTGTLIIGIFAFLFLVGLAYWLRRRYLRKKKLACACAPLQQRNLAPDRF